MKIICLFGNGSVNYSDFSRVQNPSWDIIACDGGARHCSALNILPISIIGDLDSLEQNEEWKNRTNVIHDPDQNTTDLEKSLDKTQADLYIAFGFAGNRFDHSLEILHVLQKYKNKHIIFFVEDDIIFRLPKKFSLSVPIGTRVSLYPLQKTESVHTQGLKYSLDGLTLEQGSMIGTSNETTEENVSLEQSEETLACIMGKEFFENILKIYI